MSDFELDPKQMRKLTDMRYDHHRRLVESGAARRILDAASPMNFLADTGPFTEGTLFFPTRERIGQMAIGRLLGTSFTLAANTVKSLSRVSDLIESCEGDVIYMRRLEVIKNGYGLSSAATGIQVERGSINPANLIPLDDIGHSDHQFVAEVLAEVQERYDAGELPCLDPEALVNLTLGRPGPIPMP